MKSSTEFADRYLKHSCFDRTQENVVAALGQLADAMSEKELVGLTDLVIVLPARVFGNWVEGVMLIERASRRGAAMIINPKLNARPIGEIKACLGACLAGMLLHQGDPATWTAVRRANANAMLKQWSVDQIQAPAQEGAPLAQRLPYDATSTGMHVERSAN